MESWGDAPIPAPPLGAALGDARLLAGRREVFASVVYGRPVLYRIPTPAIPSVGTEDKGEPCGLWIAFDLADIPHHTRCIATYLHIRFDDPAVLGVDMTCSGERLGISYDGPPQPTSALAEAALDALRERPGWAERLREGRYPGPPAFIGSGENRIGLFFGGFSKGDPSLPTAYAVHSIITKPRGLPELTGTLRVDASFIKGRHRRTIHATSRPTTPFVVTPERSAPHLSARAPGVRLCMAADIERFSRLDNREAEAAQERLLRVLAEARQYAGIDEGLVELQESGDGQLAILPSALDESVVIPRLVERLRAALSVAGGQGRIRIRVALHRGHVAPGPNGWLGNSTIAVHRLLDSVPLRAALAENPAADFALVVSSALYVDVIAHHYGRLAPESFRQVSIDIPEKDFAEKAWIHVPCD